VSYLSNFERSFSEHTLAVVEQYEGEFDATLLINCLLGLLVVPKETVLHAIPATPLSELDRWGISPSSIKNPGVVRGKNDPDPKTLRGLVFNLRHAVAHFRIKPVPDHGEVQSFEFRNDRELHAVVSIDELREFVKRLSAHLKDQ
jgi:hypothetical protein